jgi:hypothetical protein
MSGIDLANTKQSKQISELRNQLEKQGWAIIKETEREFKGKPTWEINDETPNLIYSWLIQRNPIVDPIWLDFIAGWDYITYKTQVNDCWSCEIRGHKNQLSFNKDKGLRVQKVLKEWNDDLKNFLEDLNEIEKVTS